MTAHTIDAETYRQVKHALRLSGPGTTYDTDGYRFTYSTNRELLARRIDGDRPNATTYRRIETT